MKKGLKEKFALVMEGGIGDIILGTPMLRAFRKKHPNAEIGVITPHKRVLEHNPNIDVLYDSSEPMDFWYRFVRNNRKNAFRPNIYETNTMNQKKPIRQAICELYNVEDDGDPCELYLTDQEEGAVKQFLSQFKLPVVVLHASGGRVRFANTKRTVNKDYPIEYLTEVVKNQMQRFQFIQLGIDGEPTIQGVPTFWNTPIGEAFALAKLCYTFISIDSFFAHAAGCFNKKGIVLWGSTSVQAYGHAVHKNIIGYEGCAYKKEYPETDTTMATCARPDGIFFDIMPGNYLSSDKTPTGRVGQLWQCPHVSCMKSITPDKVINALLDIHRSIDRSQIETELKLKIPVPKKKLASPIKGNGKISRVPKKRKKALKCLEAN